MQRFYLFLGIALGIPVIFFLFMEFNSVKESAGFFKIIPQDVVDFFTDWRDENDRIDDLSESLKNDEIFDYIEDELAAEEERIARGPRYPETISYRATINTNWFTATSSETLPSNAHFSAPVIWSADETRSVFREGSLSSPGIKLMAETGKTETLEQELVSIGSNGGLFHYNVGKRIESIDTQELIIRVSQNSDLVSAVSMIAPSPDWFIAAFGVDLFDENKGWIASTSIDMVLLDAGTEEGQNFDINNNKTDPQAVISKSEARNAENSPFATLILEQIIPTE